jgi:hypothetical protein
MSLKWEIITSVGAGLLISLFLGPLVGLVTFLFCIGAREIKAS